VYADADLTPVKSIPLPPRWMAALLGLPNAMFARTVSRMLANDPLALSSMWEDLEARRATEARCFRMPFSFFCFSLRDECWSFSFSAVEGR
jgi:hypothetical protein